MSKKTLGRWKSSQLLKDILVTVVVEICKSDPMAFLNVPKSTRAGYVHEALAALRKKYSYAD